MSQTSSESILFSLVWKIRDPFAHFTFHWGYSTNTAARPHCLLIRSDRKKMLAPFFCRETVPRG